MKNQITYSCPHVPEQASLIWHTNHVQDEPGVRKDPAHPALLYLAKSFCNIQQVLLNY
jgi:hypothetical protein